MSAAAAFPGRALDPALRARIEALHEEGRALFRKFDREVRREAFHPFMPADYGPIIDALLPFRDECRTFLEWGSATGVIAITADLLGFEAYGIEIDAQLVEIARDLARRHGSQARFAAGSMLPAGYEWRAASGDPRLGTIERGDPGYEQLGRTLSEFDLIYGYPWSGEDEMMRDLMRRHGADGGRLLLNGAGGIRVYEVREGELRSVS
ncbi:MAG TPA: hypothetical protein VFZ24_01750 [Longimicrobiales bacterium]